MDRRVEGGRWRTGEENQGSNMDVSQVLGLSNWMTKGGREDMETKSLAGLRMRWTDAITDFHIGCGKSEMFLTYQKADVDSC